MLETDQHFLASGNIRNVLWHAVLQTALSGHPSRDP
jgi:hypothetical protein